MRAISAILVFTFLATCSIAVETESIGVKDLPPEISVKGKFIEGLKWKDKNGVNILILSFKGTIDEKTPYGDVRSIFLYGEQYVVNNGSVKLLWDIIDFEKACDFSASLTGNGFIENSTTITDLDQDGITETLIAYKLVCRGEPWPAQMKILIHENNVKYGLRGSMLWLLLEAPYDKLPSPLSKIDFDDFEYDKSKVTEDEKEWYRKENFEHGLVLGRYRNENDFQNAPKVFLLHAKKQWRKLMIERL